MKLTLFFAIVFAAFMTTEAGAWDGKGHMMVAAIAYDNLDKTTVRPKVDALIKLNPMYSTWIRNVAPADRGKVAFVYAATWPDLIKSDKKHFKDDGEDPAKSPDPAQNVGYKPKGTYMHRYWHFVDEPFSSDDTPLQSPKTPNAQTQIAVFRQVLASNSEDQGLKSYDLVWLEHLVGDVHQPLHATSRFTKDLPDGDRGGNLVTIPSACYHELHCYWDNVKGQTKSATAAITAASKLQKADKSSSSQLDEKIWIDESFTVAKESVYKDPPIGPTGAGPYTLTVAYKTNAQKIAAERIALAGARLANVLNEALK